MDKARLSKLTIYKDVDWHKGADYFSIGEQMLGYTTGMYPRFALSKNQWQEQLVSQVLVYSSVCRAELEESVQGFIGNTLCRLSQLAKSIIAALRIAVIGFVFSK